MDWKSRRAGTQVGTLECPNEDVADVKKYTKLPPSPEGALRLNGGHLCLMAALREGVHHGGQAKCAAAPNRQNNKGVVPAEPPTSDPKDEARMSAVSKNTHKGNHDRKE